MAFQTEEDIQLTKKIIIRITKRYNQNIIFDNIELNNLANDILNTVYNIGGSFDKSTITAVAEVRIKDTYNIE